MPKNTTFNQQVQADTLWVKVPGVKHKLPVLMMSDAHTRLLAARFIKAETSEEYIKQIEAAWISFFGPMKTLPVDVHQMPCENGQRNTGSNS